MNHIRKINQVLSFVLVVALLVQLLPVFATEPVETPYYANSEATPEIIGQMEARRTEGSKQFRMSNGSYLAASYALPMHFTATQYLGSSIRNQFTGKSI